MSLHSPEELARIAEGFDALSRAASTPWPPDPLVHPRNTHGCCDGRGQVHRGFGALSYVSLCRNGCGSDAWDRECDTGSPSAQEQRPATTSPREGSA